MFNYLVNCPGGSKSTCMDACSSNKCGVPAGSAVTPATLECVNSCQTTCSGNCDLSGLIILYMEK